MRIARFLIGIFSAAFCLASAHAADRETLVISQTPKSDQIRQHLFPDECESDKYTCMKVRPSTERAISMDVRFPTASAELTPETKTQLDVIGEALATRRGKLKPGEILIEGHTDVRGSAEYNQRLSEKRAQAVAKHLISAYRLDSKALKPVGRGKEQPRDLAHADSEVNRRVEFVRVPN